MSISRFLNVQAHCIITLFIFTTITALAPIAAVAQEVTRAGVSLTDTDASPGGGADYRISDAGDERQPSGLFDIRSVSDETLTAGQAAVQPGTSMLQSFSGIANPEPDETFVNEYTVTNTNDSGTGSLRWAVDQTNSNSTRDKISFSIPGEGPHIIQVQSQFFSFQYPVIVDATTQPGYGEGSPVIVLDGSAAPEGVNGLVFTVPAGESIVRGFSIVGFRRQTVSPFSGGNAIIFFSSGNTVTGNFIGLLPDGTPAGNTGTGILIQASSANLIGGRTAAERNVISANLTGIDIRQGSGGNVVEGNYIGTSPDGAEARGNRFNLQIIASGGNQIGGSAAGAGNVISGALMVETSGGSGVIIAGSGGTPSSNNTLSGNLIGTNAAGTAALPNMRAGILLLFNATDNTIGGTTQAHRNIISGNGPYGIFLQASDTSPVTGNIIAGNYIGADINGGALGNTYGILALGPVGTNRIGHPAYPRNVISGNTNTGIFLAEGNGMIVQNNLIGTSPAGNSAVPNAVDGVYIGTPGNSIGGTGTLEGNVISGNTRHGILISGNAASGNTVARNHIGLNLQGQGGLGNGRYGVNIINAPENLVTGNFITDNGQASNAAGIEVAGSGATGNVIRANGIGVDATGNQAIGNRGAGIIIRASNTMIGGNSSSDGNIISGNTTHGIFITTFQAAGTSQNTIRHNRIGTGIDGQTPLGNTVNGILIDGSSSNMVGGESGLIPAYPNTIAHNGRNGVALTTGFLGEQPYSNAILGNSLYANGLQGIDLGNNGRSSNDADDSDDGPNQLQNFPVITDLEYDAVGNQFTLSYSVPSSPTNSGYPLRVEFFLTDGDNQGRTYIGYDIYEESDFNVGKTVVVPLVSLVTFGENDGVTATATDNDFQTSEFADVVPVTTTDPGETGFYVVVNTSDSGEGSLRWAIDQANSNADTARITFNIPGNVPHVIRPQSQYVSFLHPVIIDATSQPGYVAGTPAIVLDGSQAPEGTNALVFTAAAGGSIVRGFSIVDFRRQSSSPFLGGEAIVLLSNGNTVTGNFIGVLPDGTARGNTGSGIVVSNASGNRIGGRNAVERNVISNNSTGIDIRNGSENNVVEGNYIGTNPAGSAAMGNRFNIQIISSGGNRIGGTAAGAGNVISAAVMVESSGGSGVVIAGSGTTQASGNTVEGNLIGTDASGTSALPNMRAGILLLFNANTNTIGGSTPAHRNIISGNGPYGVFMQASETSPVTGNVIAGNYIGLDVNGAALPNNVGLLTFGPVGENFIGHPQFARNVISGNVNAGIQINEGNGLLIRNNHIGTDPAGQSAVPNSLDGILIFTSGNRIGGSIENEGNVISGNTRHGIHLQGSNASGNIISGNMIGLGADGSTGVGNGRYGIQISGGPENLISGNVISDNGRTSNAAGIELFGAGAQGNLIRANRIGTDATGTAAVGNRGAGILVRAPGNRIGGDDPSERNIISGNTTHGIFITNFQAETSGTTTIRNNYIGVAADGTTALGNTLNGVLIDGTSSNMIGGGSGLTSFPNVIAHNGRNGVTLTTGFGDVVPYSNAILGNSIHSNGLSGIDLANNGRTPNDAGDSDDGPNKLQNFPEIGTVTYDAETNRFTVFYTVPSAPANSVYPIRVELFIGGTDNQGRTYIGSDTFAQTDYNTQKTIEFSPNTQITVDSGTRITATATDSVGNTSEFADAVPVTEGDPGTGNEFVVTNTNDSGEGSLRWAIDQANSSDSAKILFNLPGNGPHIIRPQTQYISFIKPVVVDATTQPGYNTGTPVIVLDGSEAPEGTNGLVFGNQASGSTVRGLSIVGFKRQATSPFSHGHAIILLGTGNTVAGNFIGLMPDGTPMGNTGTGVLVQGASGNLIGGRTLTDRNIISANNTGIDFRAGANNNVAEGNYVGTNPSGDEARGNRFNVSVVGSSGNRIGGSEQGAGNLISGALRVENSGGSGLVIAGSGATAASGNTVAGNLIGTNAAGTEAIPNMRAGVLMLFNATNNIIGGQTEAHRNIISGNDPYGILLQASDTSPVTGNIIAGNYIGLSHNGEAIPNKLGILAFGPVGENRIGHPEYPPNVISGNAGGGVQINDPTSSWFNGFIVQNNFIGTGPDGNSAVGNTFDGILMFSSGNVIGGTGENERNVVAGNLQHGIRIASNASSGNMIVGNYVGIGADGETGIGNRDGGIIISDAPENMVAGNVVSDNGARMNGGIHVFGSDAVGNAIRANRIGTNASGTEAVGNQGSGIEIRAFDTIVGGNSPEDGNLISGNTAHGIYIFSRALGDAGRTTIRNNFIGTGADGISPLGNGQNGIFIEGSSSNVIGGESGLLPAFPNVIAHNGGNGIGLINYQEDWLSVSNAILGNSIYANALLGIDLGSNDRTPNDADDSDDGPNRLQNFPEISDLEFDAVANSFTLTYTVPSAPANSAYPLRVEFFLTSGDNQGRTYLGFDLFGEGDFSAGKTIELPLASLVTIGAGNAVTATATDNGGNTSEFADAVPAGASTVVTRTISSSGTFIFNEEGQVTGVSITVDDLENGGSLSVTYDLATVENFEWAGTGEIELGEVRWVIKTDDLTAGSFTIEFNLDDISGLPEFGDITELVVLKRDEPGTGTFEVLSSTIQDNSLFVTVTGFSEFTIGRASGLVSIDDPATGFPSAYVLHQNYPNPFNPSTNIRFELPESVPVRLEVFTITGQRVAELVNETRSAGHHTVTFDASLHTSGMYIYRLQAGAYSSTGKMMLVK